MEMEVEDPVGSINWSRLQSGMDPGLRRRALSRAGCCDKGSPCCQATQENEREKSGPALEPMHYFTQQVTTQHTGTNANRRRGVS